ncbi:MAG: hypothetical protein A2751_04615 [Candidatus Doudnabacteria bacterium RIFCSPHIGHO2_01_FULL_46_14]|uniref:SGNH hydrolase-type esterase domain-containing protein n=1 Tax=Candidatus Doudnabacteria bacterium RIFCSPHIGHO2_01_FULL_46_14 TaxID=1817824 RepID=A0A1F5NNI6_9BACT|nr:MAG: hypothetical protein A2751_04615 [Candidatus Doudnabacteria bacterium RIFCSPHIGHO2_01_FULL_46_14]
MKLKLIIAGIIGIAIALAMILFSGPTIVDRPEKGTNIIAFGDSLVTGYGVTTLGDDFVSLLSKRTGRTIINAGSNGDTTASALARLDRDVLSQDPRIVIVLVGGNDALRQVPVEESFKNLVLIVDRIHEKGAAVILLGVKGSLLGDKYDSEFKKLAKEKKANFVPNILKDIFGNPEMLTDGIHPNNAGHAIMADRIEPILKKLLQ